MSPHTSFGEFPCGQLSSPDRTPARQTDHRLPTLSDWISVDRSLSNMEDLRASFLTQHYEVKISDHWHVCGSNTRPERCPERITRSPSLEAWMDEAVLA